MNKRLLTVFALALLPAVPGLYSQNAEIAPAYRDSRMVNSHSRIIMQSRTMFGLEAEFSNLGEVGYPVDNDDNGDGEIIEFVFNDGYINLSEDESTLSDQFQFNMENAKVGTDGLVDSFTLSRYRSTATDEVFTEDPTSLPSGWELAYQYEWGTRKDRMRFGFIAGIAVSNLKFRTNQTIHGDLYVQTANVSLNGPRITYSPGGSYVGSEGGPLIDLINDVDFNNEIENLVTQDVWGEGEVVVPSTVSSLVDHDGVLANFRIGPVVNYHLGHRIHLQASAGVNLTYYHSNVTVSETLEDLLNNNDFSVYENVDSGEWLPGFYVEAASYYFLNNRTAAYTSLQLYNVNSPDSDSIEGVNYKINLKGSTVFSMGIKLAL